MTQCPQYAYVRNTHNNVYLRPENSTTGARVTRSLKEKDKGEKERTNMLTYVPKITAAKKFSKHPASNCCKMYYQWEKHVQYFHSWMKIAAKVLKNAAISPG